MSQVKDSVEVDPEVPQLTMGIRYGVGAFAREPKRVAARRLFRGSAGQFMFSRIDTQRGAFACIPVELDGHLVTNEFPLYEPINRDELDVRFLLLYFRQQSVLDQIDQVRAGSEGRSRWKEADFEAWRIPLPPLVEQRRIVDVMAAVDAQIEALATEVEAGSRGVALLSERLLASLDATRFLGDLTSTRSGPSFAATDVSDKPLSGAVPVVGIPNTKPDGTFDLNGVGWVSGLPSSVATIGPDSLVLIRTNGNRSRIGNVYRPPAEAHGHAVSAFQFLMRLHDSRDRDFVFWTLARPSMQASMSESASGTTGLGNMAVKWLNAQQIPWSEDSDQRAEIVGQLNDSAMASVATQREHRSLVRFRSTLLSALLAQQVEIPESYDALLDDALKVSS